MGALDEFLAGTEPSKGVTARDMSFPKAAPKTDQRLGILQQELDDANERLKNGDTRAQADIDAINREMRFIGGKSAPVSPAAPAVSTLDEFLSGGAEPEQGPPVSVEVSGGVAQEPVTEQPTMGEKLVGLGELGLAATTGLVAPIVGGAAGIAENVLGGTLGTQEGLRKAEKTAGEVSEALTYEPRTEAGKAITGRTMSALQQAFEASKLPPVMPEALPMASAQKPGVQKPSIVKPVAQRVEPTMQPTMPRMTMAGKVEPTMTAANQPQMAGVGAAARTNEAALQQALTQASPELRQELAKLKPEEVNVPVLERHLEADSLPVPVRLTKGQALQDPVLISRERNERGLKEQYANFLNQQNKDLQESANLMKERVAPDVNTTSFVEDAENAIDLMNKRIKADDQKITEAYNALKNYGAGKLEVDSQTFGNNALKALGEFDESEFLPSAILNRIEAYSKGKPMNFNQFENLRTVLARETRMAQSANDGNKVHALTVVRSELEKMPLLNETGEAKTLADQARSLAKAQFDLLDKKRDTYNPLYADVMNGVSDTKDFIPKLVFRSKNKEFAKTLETLQDDPQALQHLRSGAMDYIIRESTDASGNFLTGKFNKLINNLDVNKKLDSLFGEEAKTLRAIANTGKLVEARPKGSFVNESNTATAAAQMAKQYGAELAKRTPVVGALVEPATQILQARKAAKEVKETLKPGAGIKIKDIGKKK